MKFFFEDQTNVNVRSRISMKGELADQRIIKMKEECQKEIFRISLYGIRGSPPGLNL